MNSVHLLYMRNHPSPREHESTLIEISKPKKTNIVIGCICKHPRMNLDESNEFYLYFLHDKLSKENKTVLLLGDFHINLLIMIKTDQQINFLIPCTLTYFRHCNQQKWDVTPKL